MGYPLSSTAYQLVLQQNPIVVDLAKQAPPTRDISIDVVLGIFMMTGLFLLAAALGSLLVAGGMVLYKRWRDRGISTTEPSHTRLRISSDVTGQRGPGPF